MGRRRAVRSAARAASRHPRAVIAIAVILILVIGVGAALYFTVEPVHNKINELIIGNDASLSGEGGSHSAGGNPSGGTVPHAQTYGTDALSFHFLQLGNNYSGDSIYIKAGETDILIDAGSRQNSADAIANYVGGYCTDKKLEYVIATHAHRDHIAGFTDTADRDGIFKRYECGVIIDFARTDATSDTYNQYVAARDAEVAAGAKHYTALECCQEVNGAQRTYELGEGMSMTVLYQRYYEESAKKTEGEENNYSVCLLFNHGDKYFLFTGDLEADGEASLVQNNTLPEVELFKAGHHGSFTASGDALLSAIKPKIVCVCCCAGSIEYTKTKNNHTFPAQEFIERVAPYTDRVYVTTVGFVEWGTKSNGSEGWKDVGFAPMNGDITVVSLNGKVTVTCSNNNTLLKDTDWFKENRTCPSAWAAPPG